MAGPTVRLEFEGDSTDLEAATDRVGNSTRRMADEVGDASDRARTAGGSLDSLSERADGAESKFTGLADVISGAGDTMTAFAEGDVAGMAAGLASMAGGIAAFVIPVIGTLATAVKTGLGSALSFIAAHPIVFALLALAAVFVLLWTNSETFRRIVTNAFNVAGRFLRDAFGSAINWVVGAFNGLMNWFAAAPGRIGGFFRGIGNAIVGAFRWAFNFVADIWNNTIGRLSFRIPNWVPFIGGNTFSAPRLPRYHVGGVMGGQQGMEGLAVLQAGERVSRPGNAGTAGVGATVNFKGNTSDALATAIMHLIRTGQIQIEV